MKHAGVFVFLIIVRIFAENERLSPSRESDSESGEGFPFAAFLHPPDTQKDEHLDKQTAEAGCGEVPPLPLLRGLKVEQLFEKGRDEGGDEGDLHTQGEGEEGGNESTGHEVQPLVRRYG